MKITELTWAHVESKGLDVVGFTTDSDEHYFVADTFDEAAENCIAKLEVLGLIDYEELPDDNGYIIALIVDGTTYMARGEELTIAFMNLIHARDEKLKTVRLRTYTENVWMPKPENGTAVVALLHPAPTGDSVYRYATVIGYTTDWPEKGKDQWYLRTKHGEHHCSMIAAYCALPDRFGELIPGVEPPSTFKHK